MGFEENLYTVVEDGPGSEVCLQLLVVPSNSGLDAPVVIRVMSTGLSATGEVIIDCFITTIMD